MLQQAAAATLSLALVLASSSPAGARGRECRVVTGTVATEQADGACPSQVGFCFRGALRTNSPLRGETFFVVTSAGPDPSDPTFLLYEGTLTVTHPSGAVTTFDTTGRINQLTGEFEETDRARSPAEAELTITGTTNATLTAFSGNVTGELCELAVGRSGP
jgi:hypothetical protein